MKKEMFCFLVLLLFISCGSQGISLGNGFLGNGKSGGLWLMLSADKAYKLTNAESWSEVSMLNISSTTGGRFVGLAYGKVNTTSNNYHWLALTRNGQLFSSTDDGATWTSKGQIANNINNFTDLATDGKGNWIAVTFDSRLYKYSFGSEWNYLDGVIFNGTEVTGIAYGNGLWALLTNNTNYLLYTSHNGDSWNDHRVFSSRVTKMAYGNSKWVAIVNSNSIQNKTGILIFNNLDTQGKKINIVENVGLLLNIVYGNGIWVAIFRDNDNRSTKVIGFTIDYSNNLSFIKEVQYSNSNNLVVVGFRP